MKPKIQSVAGMHDILPDDQKYYEKIYETAKEIADFYGFSRIETPILEDSDLFIKGGYDHGDCAKTDVCFQDQG